MDFKDLRACEGLIEPQQKFQEQQALYFTNNIWHVETTRLLEFK